MGKILKIGYGGGSYFGVFNLKCTENLKLNSKMREEGVLKRGIIDKEKAGSLPTTRLFVNSAVVLPVNNVCIIS